MQTTISITSKRQATFPKHLLKILGAEPGDRLVAHVENKKVILEPAGKGILDLVGTMPKINIPKGRTVEDIISQARDQYYEKTVR